MYSSLVLNVLHGFCSVRLEKSYYIKYYSILKSGIFQSAFNTDAHWGNTKTLDIIRKLQTLVPPAIHAQKDLAGMVMLFGQ